MSIVLPRNFARPTPILKDYGRVESVEYPMKCREYPIRKRGLLIIDSLPSWKSFISWRGEIKLHVGFPLLVATVISQTR
jgi:hypothetical protein